MPASRGRAKFTSNFHRAHRSKKGMSPYVRQRKDMRAKRDERLDDIIADEFEDEIKRLT